MTLLWYLHASLSILSVLCKCVLKWNSYLVWTVIKYCQGLAGVNRMKIKVWLLDQWQELGCYATAYANWTQVQSGRSMLVKKWTVVYETEFSERVKVHAKVDGPEFKNLLILKSKNGQSDRQKSERTWKSKVNGSEIQKWTALKSKSGRFWNPKVEGPRGKN